MASPRSKLTSALLTPMSPSRARLTRTGQAPQVMPSIWRWAMASSAVPAATGKSASQRAGRTPRKVRRFMQAMPPLPRWIHGNVHRGWSAAPLGGGPPQEVRRGFRASISPAAALFADVKIEPGTHADNADGDEDRHILHRRGHECAAPQPERHDGNGQDAAKRGYHCPPALMNPPSSPRSLPIIRPSARRRLRIHRSRAVAPRDTR